MIHLHSNSGSCIVLYLSDPLLHYTINMRFSMFIISPTNLIKICSEIEDKCPHIYFPVRLLSRCIITYSLFIFLTALIFYHIFIFVAIFIGIMTMIYGYLLLRFWKLLGLSVFKYILSSILLWISLIATAIVVRTTFLRVIVFIL